MARRMIKVTPVIGVVTNDRLRSLGGCHAVHERAVSKGFTTADSIGDAIEEALREIALSEAAGRQPYRIGELTYLVTFIVD